MKLKLIFFSGNHVWGVRSSLFQYNKTNLTLLGITRWTAAWICWHYFYVLSFSLVISSLHGYWPLTRYIHMKISRGMPWKLVLSGNSWLCKNNAKSTTNYWLIFYCDIPHNTEISPKQYLTISCTNLHQGVVHVNLQGLAEVPWASCLDGQGDLDAFQYLEGEKSSWGMNQFTKASGIRNTGVVYTSRVRSSRISLLPGQWGTHSMRWGYTMGKFNEIFWWNRSSVCLRNGGQFLTCLIDCCCLKEKHGKDIIKKIMIIQWKWYHWQQHIDKIEKEIVKLTRICSASFNCLWRFLIWQSCLSTSARNVSIFSSTLACSRARSSVAFSSLSLLTKSSVSCTCSLPASFWCFIAMVFSKISLKNFKRKG